MLQRVRHGLAHREVGVVPALAGRAVQPLRASGWCDAAPRRMKNAPHGHLPQVARSRRDPRRTRRDGCGLVPLHHWGPGTGARHRRIRTGQPLDRRRIRRSSHPTGPGAAASPEPRGGMNAPHPTGPERSKTRTRNAIIGLDDPRAPTASTSGWSCVPGGLEPPQTSHPRRAGRRRFAWGYNSVCRRGEWNHFPRRARARPVRCRPVTVSRVTEAWRRSRLSAGTGRGCLDLRDRTGGSQGAPTTTWPPDRSRSRRQLDTLPVH